MDVLLLGGSFDPPHLGHAALLKAALKRVKPDIAYVAPAYRSPLKAGAQAGPRERLRMIQATLGERLSAAEKRPVRVLSFELERRKPSYTFETLRFLKKKHPGARLTFVAGSDAFASFPSWKKPGELRRACNWLVARRPGAKLTAPGGKYPAYSVLPGSFPDLSSTLIRCRLLAGTDGASALARGVQAIIRRGGLYGLDLRKKLAASLSPERYAHSVCVAERSLEFALAHGHDPERAVLAGLLHDCGRAVPVPRMARYALSRRLDVPCLRETAERAPLLLHAYIGEDIARREYGIVDKEVLGAIRKHTLGDTRMSALERLVYVADACSADRRYPEAPKIHKAALSDLDEGLSLALRAKLEYALQNGSWLHPLSVTLWNREN